MASENEEPRATHRVHTLSDLTPEMQDLLYKRLDNELAWKKVRDNLRLRAGPFRFWGGIAAGALLLFGVFRDAIVWAIGGLARAFGVGQ